jgi:hypothetical protein
LTGKFVALGIFVQLEPPEGLTWKVTRAVAISPQLELFKFLRNADRVTVAVLLVELLVQAKVGPV